MATAEPRTLLFVAAEAGEFAGLLRRTLARPWDIDVAFARQADVAGERWLLVANGPGPRLAAAAVDKAASAQGYQAIISTGYCGGLAPHLAPLAIVEANLVLDTATGARYPARTGQAVLASGDRLIATAAEKHTLHQATGADAVDMEACAVAERAHRRGTPFYCVRVVSDSASEDMPLDFNHYRHPDGRFSKGRIAAAALARPFTVLPNLIRLGRRAAEASRKLGDFLAGCRF